MQLQGPGKSAPRNRMSILSHSMLMLSMFLSPFSGPKNINNLPLSPVILASPARPAVAKRDPLDHAPVLRAGQDRGWNDSGGARG